MNPFEVHSRLMTQYHKMVSKPINGKTGGYVVYAGAEISAVIGAFEFAQVFRGSGFSTETITSEFRALGQVIIQKSELPDGISFHTGQDMTVYHPGGSVRYCKIETIQDVFAEWRLLLADKHQKA